MRRCSSIRSFQIFQESITSISYVGREEFTSHEVFVEGRERKILEGSHEVHKIAKLQSIKNA